MSPQRTDWEKKLEKHFCHKLDINGKYKIYLDSEITVDKQLCLHWEMLEDFLRNTQPEDFNNLKTELGYDWKTEVGKKIEDELNEKPLFNVLRDGINVNTYHLDLAYFKPPTTNNPEQLRRYKQNIFSAIRQYHFSSSVNVRDEEDERQSIDIVICLNGFIIITIELKHTMAGQNVHYAVQQCCLRETTLPIFNNAFVHFAADDEKAKVATTFSRPPIKDDFIDFNMGLVNIKPNENEYAIHYLYDEILLPDNILNFIENYLYGTKDKWIFPRYHQQRCVKRVFNDIIAQYKKYRKLNLRYLIQHSAGSGKSNTIVWLVQNLRVLHIDDVKLFDHIVVLTHRINLDDQISKDFLKAIDQMGVVAYCKNSNDLKLALGVQVEGYRNPEIPPNSPVIVTILHKFSYLKEISDQTNKKICFIIDEAHTSQEGTLHESMVEIFDEATGLTIKQKQEEVTDDQEELVEEISRKEFPNLTFIALTATPSDRTLEKFGQKADEDGSWSAFDTYTMDEAIKEGYIMDVAKNIIAYETLYELNYQYKSDKEYPALQVYKALKLKAFEDDEVIKEKCKIITEIFKNQTAQKIDGKAKAMVVTSSRLSAVKYKIFLDEELKRRGLKWKSLVAFSGQINYNDKFHTETEMNKLNNPQNLKIEDCFNQNNDIRFLIVANKFQVGFNEPLLHTMFLDKAVSDRNAVQTISRLNRIYPPYKEDTLTVDFTNSYDEIIKAFRKYQHNVESHKEANPQDLFKLKDELLKRGIFTLEDVEECVRLFKSPIPNDNMLLTALMTKIKGILEGKFDLEKKREFRTLLYRYVSLFNYIKSLFRIPEEALHDFKIFATLLYRKLDPTMSAEDLQREIEQVKLKSYDISAIETKPTDEPPEDGDGEIKDNGGSITFVKNLATVEEIVIAINLRFKEKISPEGIEIVEGYLKSLHQETDLKTTIKNNLKKDEKQVYDLVVKSVMDRIYTDYIIDKSPEHYTELTEDNIQSFVNQGAYKMLREMLRSAA